ncbi:hypothetical protein OB236_10455 [Paenibacillus sp. WQ 127069]|uniref:Uncharacterized protein n=1 Tax=Paenibacillus baimaensis TaxID=2982185 RepID=A0ABT2UFV1_9BACL|nr:hypothetical protein [Paenibacillus sp. WQ 127069]MCU6792549.1 hypothetical protein [Paenibacillus sp. WQ 127069]
MWIEPIDDIQDPTVTAWLSHSTKSNTQSQWLFLPQHTSISLLTVEGQPTVFSFSHSWRKTTKPNEEQGDPKQILEELNHRNKAVFKAVERHIRKKMLKEHRYCISALQGLLKAEGKEFPPICPYAYAYVFWRTTILKSTRFYSLPWGDDIEEGRVAAQIISEKISYLKSRFLHHSKTEPITQNRINQLYWIIDKITVNFCFNFFEQWLQQAGKGVSEVRVPNWHQINQTVECSFPQMAFNYSVAPGDGTLIECYFKPENHRAL